MDGLKNELIQRLKINVDIYNKIFLTLAPSIIGATVLLVKFSDGLHPNCILKIGWWLFTISIIANFSEAYISIKKGIDLSKNEHGKMEIWNKLINFFQSIAFFSFIIALVMIMLFITFGI